MSIVPSGLLNKYNEFAQHFLDDFGTVCTLVYPELITTTTNVPDIKFKKTLNINPFDDFSRGSQDFKSTPQTESITLRLYWSKKDYQKVGNVILPDGGVAGYGLIGDLHKVVRAKELIIYPNILTPHIEWRFVKFAEPVIYGLTRKEFISYWARSDA